MSRNIIMFIVGTAVLLFSYTFSSMAAHADARDFYKCKLADEVKAEAIIKLASDFMKIARKEGYKDYSMELLWPLYGQDISEGTFYWAGLSPSASRGVATEEFWRESDANEEIRNRFQSIATCESSSIYLVTKIK